MTTKATLFLSGIGNDICSPFFDYNGKLYAILQTHGEVVSIDSSNGQVDIIHSTGGQPNGACFDTNNESLLYITDFIFNSVLAINNNNQEILVNTYEEKQLKGPNSIIFVNNTIFFTDSGPLGETGLHSPTGSLFQITNGPTGQLLRSISLNNLAYPSGITATNDGKFIYVAEMMNNRILRYFQYPDGIYHGSVFYQLSGSIGPSCIAIDSSGNLYVGQYDIKDSKSDGLIYVISKSGKLINTIIVNGPEISGLAIRSNFLYITEKSTGSIYRCDIKD